MRRTGFRTGADDARYPAVAGLIVLSPWHSTAPKNGDELGQAQAAKVSGPIPTDAVIEYFSGLGGVVAKVNRIEIRPEYIRIHGLAFEEYLIETVTD
jgi:hypothetical protein